MRTSQILVLCVSFLVGYIAATALNRPSAGQPPAPQPVGQEVAVGRYQLTVPIQRNFDRYAILTDTATGRCWMRHSSWRDKDPWPDLGSPVTRK